MRTIGTLSLILLLMLPLAIVYVQPISAQYTGNITINSDGSITPSNATIQQTGDIFTLTEDVQGGIVVERNNTILDGGGHLVYGRGMGYLDSYILINSSGSVWNVTVQNFNIVGDFMGKEIGIELVDAFNAAVVNNTIREVGSLLAMNGIFYSAIYVSGGCSNNITGNNLIGNLNGMFFDSTSDNLIVENNVTNTSNCGLSGDVVSFVSASNNSIYHNDFINFSRITVSNSVNLWDDGYPNGGNFWSDYMAKNPNADARSKLGIYNLPYVIDPENRDRYPLIKPFDSAWYAVQTVPPQVSVLSPLSKKYNSSEVPLVFTVDRAVNWEGYSLDGKPTVPITGNGTIANVTNGKHALTVYANSTWGTIGTSETIGFTIAKPEPLPTSIIVLAVATVVAIAGVGLLVYLKKYRR